MTKEEEITILNRIRNDYDQKINPYYAAARLWVDDIIDPLDTRKIISLGIEMANHAPITQQMNVGILQT